MNNGLVIYYSLTGNVEYIANKLKNDLNFDLCEVKTVFNLKNAGFLKIFLGVFQVIFKIHPKIIYNNVDFSKYERIIIGTPVWANSFVPALNKFFKEVKIEQKKISFFVCCNGGEGNALTDLKNSLSNNSFEENIVFFDAIKNKETTEKTYNEFISKLKNN